MIFNQRLCRLIFDRSFKKCSLDCVVVLVVYRHIRVWCGLDGCEGSREAIKSIFCMYNLTSTCFSILISLLQSPFCSFSQAAILESSQGKVGEFFCSHEILGTMLYIFVVYSVRLGTWRQAESCVG